MTHDIEAWINLAAHSTDPETVEDVAAILQAALDLVLTDSIEERSRQENRLRGRLAQLRRLYDRPAAAS